MVHVELTFDLGVAAGGEQKPGWKKQKFINVGLFPSFLTSKYVTSLFLLSCYCLQGFFFFQFFLLLLFVYITFMVF